MITIDDVLCGNYVLDNINEDDYHKIWSVLRMKIDELERKHGRMGDGTGTLRALQKQMNDLVTFGSDKTKLYCSVCEKDASWNTPYIVEDTERKWHIVCDTCARADRSDRLMIGIEQRSDWKGGLKYDRHHTYRYNGHVIVFSPNENGGWSEGPYAYKGRYLRFGAPMPSISAWTHDGAAWIMTDHEKMVAIQDPLRILKQMDLIMKHGKYRCTTCGKTFPNHMMGGRPLFAGKVCPECWKLHEQKMEQERKDGKICSLCRKPYGECYC